MTRSPDGADPVCPLCERPLPRHARQSVHHLIPKLKGGAKGPTVRLHEICHRTIHKNLTETELARTYNTIEALRASLSARFTALGRQGDKGWLFDQPMRANLFKRVT